MNFNGDPKGNQTWCAEKSSIYTDVQLLCLETGGYLMIFNMYNIFICYVSGWFNLGLSLCLFLGDHLCISLFEENS